MPLAETNHQPTAIVAVRTRITIGGTSYDCQSCPADVADTAEPILVTTTASQFEVALPGAVIKSDALEVKVLKQDVKPEVGSLADLVIETDESTNGGVAATKTKTIPCTVASVKPDSIESDGNRLLAWAVSLRPTNIGRVAI